MSNVVINDESLSAIAYAIRDKGGTHTFYKPSEMAAAINSIPQGITPTGTVNISQNGTTDVTNYASANVNVPNSYAAEDEGKVVLNGALVEQAARSSSITVNGTYDTTNNNSVTVDVSGGSQAPIIIDASPNNSYSAYLRMYNPNKSVLNPKWSIPFELGITFLQTATATRSRVLFGPTNGYVSAPTFEIQSSTSGNAFWFGISNGSSQAYNSVITKTEFPIALNKWMFMKMFYDGTTGGVVVTDGTNTITKSQILGFTPTSSQPVFQLGGINVSVNHYAQNVLFDMGNTYFKQNGTLIWGAERGSLPS